MSFFSPFRFAAVCSIVGAMAAGCSSTVPTYETASAPVRREQPRTPRTTRTPAPTVANSPEVINVPRSSRGNPPFYEVFGERYYVMDEGEGYRATGVASWYGKDFHGRPTSSGEEYDMNAFTAAHKTLPIPTWVEVTNQRNGRRVIVKVNDRGPFVDDRIIDLSFAAATEIGMVTDGTAPVTVRALGAPAAAPPAPAVTTTVAGRPSGSTGSSTGGFSIISQAHAGDAVRGAQPFRQQYLQVGAFSDSANADRVVGRLQRSGFSNSFIIPDNASTSGLHLVRVGPLADEAEIDAVLVDLNALGFDANLVLEP